MRTGPRVGLAAARILDRTSSVCGTTSAVQSVPEFPLALFTNSFPGYQNVTRIVMFKSTQKNYAKKLHVTLVTTVTQNQDVEDELGGKGTKRAAILYPPKARKPCLRGLVLCTSCI